MNTPEPLLILATNLPTALVEAMDRGLDPRAADRPGGAWMYVVSARTVLGRTPGWYALRLVPGVLLTPDQREALDRMISRGWRVVADDWRAGEAYR